MIHALWQDGRFAFRMLARSPGFTAAALLSLALGSGVTSSIFSVVRAVILTPLPYPAPERLMLIASTKSQGAEAQDWPVSYLDFQDLREHNRSFSEVAARTEVRSFNIAIGGEPEHVNGEMVSASYFHLLGTAPIVGRTFSPQEDSVAAQPLAAVIGYALWRRHFAGAADLARQDLTVNGERYVVIGVLPAGFKGLTDQAEIWIPVSRASSLLAPRYLEKRNFRWLSVLGRLKPGGRVESARAELSALAAALRRSYPDSNQGIGFRLWRLVDFWYGDLRPILITLLVAALFVLLIACANVASLFVVRGLARHEELALRAALGATSPRLVRQLLTESVLLALLGSLLGSLLAVWTTGLLAASGLPGFRSYVDIHVDAVVVATGIALTVACLLLASLVPALSTIRAGLGARLRQGVKGTAGLGRLRLQHLFVIAEVALAVALLAGAALMIREFERLRRVDLGFRSQDLLTLRFDLADRQFRDDERVRALVRGLGERLGRTPGVEKVAFAGDIPTDEGFTTLYQLEGGPEGDGVLLHVHSVSPNYFSALAVPLLEGRVCAAEDSETAPPVAVVSHSLARRWPGERALGRRLKAGRLGSESPWLTVVGVVADVRQLGLQGDSPPDVYSCLAQSPPRTPPILSLLVRPAGVSAASLISPLRRAARELAATLPPYDLATMEQRLDTQAARGRFLALLMSLFSLLALVLAVVGIYGVISYNVDRRRREIGIRVAVGADRASILWLIVSSGAALALGGIVAGLLLSLALNRALVGFLVGTFRRIEPANLGALAGTSLLILVVAIAASYFPARRATRFEAALTLRQE